MRYAFVYNIVVLFSIAGAGTAYAASMDHQDNIQLVPYAFYANANETTVVGITALGSSDVEGEVYWTFFDANGERRANGRFELDPVQQYSFIWAAEAEQAGTDLAGQAGFLLFAYDTDDDGQISVGEGASITAQAFLLDTERNDVAFLPTVRVNEDQLSDNQPNDWDQSPIRELLTTDATSSDADLLELGLRYFVDGEAGNGNGTELIIFTTSSSGSSQEFEIYDGSGDSETIDVDTPNSHLNILDPEQIGDFPDNFRDGTIIWNLPGGGDPTVYFFAFSLLRSEAFGATQTLLGNYFDRR